jgi:hypothetical protein
VQDLAQDLVQEQNGYHKRLTDVNEPEQKPKSRTSALRVVGSVLAAGFGVQSAKNRERDFKDGKFMTFVIAGLVFTALFVASVYLVVTVVLENAR